MGKPQKVYINEGCLGEHLRELRDEAVSFVDIPGHATLGAVVAYPEQGADDGPVMWALAQLGRKGVPVFVIDRIFNPAHSRAVWLDRNVAGYLVGGDERTWPEILAFFRKRLEAVRLADAVAEADLLEVGWSVEILPEDFRNFNFVSLFIGSMREFMTQLKQLLELSKPRDIAANPVNGKHNLALLMELAWAKQRGKGSHKCSVDGRTYTQKEIDDILKESDAARVFSEGSPAMSQGHFLIQGDTGTGKSIIANFIHEYLYEEARHGPQAPDVGMLQKVTCTNIGEKILENELFGSIYGYFSDGITQPGAIFMAYNGTLFLDEIGDLPLGMQAKLLQYLDERTIRPTGWLGKPIYIPAVVVAATNRDLRRCVEEGTFRLDLFHRLGHIVTIPPLRDRLDDMERLADFVLQNPRINPVKRSGKGNARAVEKIERAAVERLKKHNFPGNFRELEQILRQAVITAAGQGVGVVTRRNIDGILEKTNATNGEAHKR